ncbi:lipase 1 [Manduca sexta]|uniref:lipase 1 n=1 Tax=Manduca sexta TaxID=7130 RepID=UPI00188F5E7A|nr:lipase 1 [Manduca sexta]
MYYYIFVPNERPEDAGLNFTQLGNKYGQTVIEHNVVTEDGYILKLFNIPGNRSVPVLLTHGILDSADTFLLRGHTSLVVYLRKFGYDVWVASVRGARYSRRHVTLDPDKDSEFWNFSVHEIGYYDLPALIDFVLSWNAVDKLSAAGHSQGNTIYYVLGATRPEYNDKVNIMIALGPISYLNHYKPPIHTIIKLGPLIDHILTTFNQEELFGDNSIYRTEINKFCTPYEVGYALCGEAFFSLAGYDVEEFEPAMFYVVIGHFPTSTSKKVAKHYLQIANNGDFVYYDYGQEKNLKLYNSETPPPYNLSAVTMNVALFVGRNDRVNPIENVRRLHKALPNVAQFKIMDREKFNHMDYIWGRHMYEYLFPYILEMLERFNS